MKSFTALLLLAAFAVHVFSNEVAIYRASYNFITEQQDLKMAEAVRDNGLPETTLITNDHEEPPDFLKRCIKRKIRCWRRAGEDRCKMLKCLDNFFGCAKEKLPSPLPSIPPLVRGCFVLLEMCRKASVSCAGELCCFVRMKRCFDLAGGE
ncbi:unnamed protein product [Pocillopora meandrina]|uniref:Uncharacterized protein n=1 Tax=Pocillopora meandrina TaxID=46732 RepID=A0AAU9W6W0_9CNID|nr:unnamed protein product [Pocillopora meandrina]